MTSERARWLAAHRLHDLSAISPSGRHHPGTAPRLNRHYGNHRAPSSSACCAPTEEAGPDVRLTGAIAGEPCFREHKIAHVTQWLARQHLQWADFGQSWFYSDSASDLPLLNAVTHPVAVRPDARLLAHAQAAGWPVIL